MISRNTMGTTPPSGVEERLDTVIKLLGAILTQGQNQTDSVKALSKFGLAPKQVAEILGVTPHQVSVTLHRTKSTKKKRKS